MRSAVAGFSQFHDPPGALASARAKLGAQLRLAESLQSGGEWTPSIIDARNNNPVTQTDADRRTAVGASANGLATMVFDGSDVHVWPLISANNATAKLGFWIWYKPATVAGVQRLITVMAVAGASENKLALYANGSTLVGEFYIPGTGGAAGRFFTSAASTLTAGAWHSIYWRYNSSLGGDANVALWVNAVSKSLTPANLGAGGTLTTLTAPTGSFVIGGNNNSDTPTQPIANGGEMRDPATFLDDLNQAEIEAWDRFERAA